MLLVLAGARTTVVETYPDTVAWLQIGAIVRTITDRRKVDMNTVIMDQVRELLTIVYECEPVCVLESELGMPFSSLDDLKRDAMMDPEDHEYQMHGAIVSREPDWVKWLVQNTTVIPTGQHLLFAAENGFFDA